MSSPQSLLIKRSLGRLFALVPGRANRRIILTYHAVGSGPMSLPSGNFAHQMDWLARHASVETLESLVTRPDIPGLRVAVTFDDGYRSVYSVAAPVLARHGFSATVYLNTGMIGESVHRTSNPDWGHYPQEEFLTWQEVTELDRMGWTVGSHGVDHVDLTKLGGEEVTRQLTASCGEIETRLGRECRLFCYTWGRHNQAVRQAVSCNGYACAVAAHHEPLSAKNDVLALPRLDIRRDYSLADFAAVVRGEWDYLGLYHKLKGALRG